jgi:hypothetical protein
MALRQFYIKNVGPAKTQRVHQKIPGPMSSKMKTNFKKSVIGKYCVLKCINIELHKIDNVN